jgi:hypothetical protein
MRPNFAFILLLATGVGFAGAAPSDIALAQGLGNGMVLQRSSNTLLRGHGPPGKTLLIRFKAGSHWINPVLKCQVDPTGQWRREVDLDTPEFQRAKGPWTLSISEEKNKKNQQEYTDILPGDVILLAGWGGQGVPADSKEIESGVQFAHDKTAIRFLDLTQTASLASGPGTAGPAWVSWPQGRTEVERYSSLSLRLAHLLALTNKYPDITRSEYVGIVLVRSRLIEEGLDARHLTTVKRVATDDRNWTWIAEPTKKAQAARSRALIFNKRHNTITNLPPIHDYDPAVTCSHDSFDSNKPPREWFTFAAAIWSFAPGRVASP